MKKLRNKKWALVLLVAIIFVLIIFLLINNSTNNKLSPGVYLEGPTTATYYKKTDYTVKIKSTSTHENAIVTIFSNNFPPIYETINLEANKTFEKTFSLTFYGAGTTNISNVSVSANSGVKDQFTSIGKAELKVKLKYDHKYKPIQYPVVKTNN